MSDLLQKIITEFPDLGGDYRGEVYAAELIKNGLPFDNLYFKPASLFRRPVSRDIESVYLDKKDDGDEQLIIELNREGLYDMLPEGIFHFSNERKGGKNKETILDEIRVSRQEEIQARKFFGPFENEFFHRRLQLELQERALLQSDSIQSRRELFEQLFGAADLLNDQQVVALLYLLPVVHKIRGHDIKSRYCLSVLLGFEVTLQRLSYTSIDYYTDDIPVMGVARLGIDAIAGNSFRSNESAWQVWIKNLSGDDLKSFFPEGHNFKLLHYLLPFLLPVNCKYEVMLHLRESDRRRHLSDETAETFLGFNCYL